MWTYRKLECTSIQSICVVCSVKKQQKAPREGKFLPYCNSCRKRLYGRGNDKRSRYTKYKKNVCESCGFVPEHPCQLDVDHIDGNHQNNRKKNLQTLCANCHRLKTYKQRKPRLT